MPEANRTQRRQNNRGGSAPPPRRDPMTVVYIVVVALIVLVIGGLLIFNGVKSQQATQASATPTPAAGAPTSKPIQLVDGSAVGKALIPAKAFTADTPKGGQGSPVDGLECAGMEYTALHIHPHLAIFYNGTQVQVPAHIGFAAVPPQGCLYWIHTHDASGIIHIEAPMLAPPGGPYYSLGMLFDIWGQPLSRDNVANLKGPVTAYVNGLRFDGDLTTIPLHAHELITLEVGKPVVSPPNYTFPIGE